MYSASSAPFSAASDAAEQSKPSTAHTSSHVSAGCTCSPMNHRIPRKDTGGLVGSVVGAYVGAGVTVGAGVGSVVVGADEGVKR